MSSDRLAHHQNSMGLVFHTATFNKEMLDTAIDALKQDQSCNYASNSRSK